MNLEFEMTEDILIVKLCGEIDHHSMGISKEEIDGSYKSFKCRNIILDLEHVTFADSSGIALIMGRYNTVKDNGGEIYICNCHTLLERILNMAGVFSLIKKYETLEEAIKNMKKGEK